MTDELKKALESAVTDEQKKAVEEKFKNEIQKLDPEELDKVAGGCFLPPGYQYWKLAEEIESNGGRSIW